MINQLGPTPAALPTLERKLPQASEKLDKVTLTLSQEQMGSREIRDFVQSLAKSGTPVAIHVASEQQTQPERPAYKPPTAEQRRKENDEYYRLLEIERAKPDWDTSQSRQAWLHWG